MTQPLSVCMLIWNFHPTVGGTEMQCLRLSRELVGHGAGVIVLTQRPPGSPVRESIDGIEVLRLSTWRWPGRLVERLSGRPAESGPDRTAYGERIPLSKAFRLVFSRFIPEYIWMARAFLALARLRGCFRILHIHEAHWIAVFGVLAGKLIGRPTVIKEATTGRKGSLRSLMPPFRSLAALGDAYIAISGEIADDLEAGGVPGHRIRRIPNGIPMPRAAWSGGNPADPFVLFVGNLSQQPIKGIDILLAAWPQVAATFPGLVLRLVGGGNSGALLEQARSLGILSRVEFLGARGDVQDQMLACRAFVLPSRKEGMSNALLEAMALGVPTVATDISGSRDLIRDGESGLLVPPEDPGAMAYAILRLLTDPGLAVRLGAGARDGIGRLCAMPSVVEGYLGVYRDLLAGPGPSASAAAERP